MSGRAITRGDLSIDNLVYAPPLNKEMSEMLFYERIVNLPNSSENARNRSIDLNRRIKERNEIIEASKYRLNSSN